MNEFARLCGRQLTDVVGRYVAGNPALQQERVEAVITACSAVGLDVTAHMGDAVGLIPFPTHAKGGDCMALDTARQRDLLVGLTTTVPSLSEAAGHISDALSSIEDDSLPVELLDSAVALGEAAAPTAEAVPNAALALR